MLFLTGGQKRKMVTVLIGKAIFDLERQKFHLQGGDFRVCLCRFLFSCQRLVACQLLYHLLNLQRNTTGVFILEKPIYLEHYDPDGMLIPQECVASISNFLDNLF